MKKTRFSRKLSLNRETLRHLDDSQIAKARGGLGAYTIGVCSTDHVIWVDNQGNIIYDPRGCVGYPTADRPETCLPIGPE